MVDQNLLIFFVVFTLVFAGLAGITQWRIHKLPEIRSLKLGRLGFWFLVNLLIAVNGAIAALLVIQFSGHPTAFSSIGLIGLVIEGILLLIFPLISGVVIPVAIVVLTVKMWRRESKSIANLLLPITMLFFLLVDWLYLIVGRLPSDWIGLKILSFAYPILSIYLAWQFLIFFLSSWIYGRKMKKKTADYYVVLGAGLVQGEKVGVLLGNRIKAAVNAAQTAKNQPIIIFSGGQGPDEKISEAAAMQKYAVAELNFPASRTRLEEKSRTTYENLVFSSQLISQEAKETASSSETSKTSESEPFLFFTSDYHVFRAALFAAQLKLQAHGGRGGKTAMYYRVPAFIREFIAVLNTQRKKHMIRVGIIVGILLLAAIYIEIRALLN